MENLFDSVGFAGFWLRVEREWAEEEKKLLCYLGLVYGDASDEEYEVCDYTGEECIGNKMFCEECSVFTDEVGNGEDTSTWKCRVCGCTDFTPCLGGCAWVEKDLCSGCAGEVSVGV